MKSLFDSSFRYVPSDMTDLRKTFARVRREQRRLARDAAREDRDPTSSGHNVTPIRTGGLRRTTS